MTTRTELTRLLTALGLAWAPEPRRSILRVPTIRLQILLAAELTRRTDRRAGVFAGEILDRAPADGERAPDGLIIGPSRGIFVDPTFGFAGMSQAVLRSCRACNRWSFIGESGSFRCRRCDAWDGDHHLIDLHDLIVSGGRIRLVDDTGVSVGVEEFARDVRAAA